MSDPIVRLDCGCWIEVTDELVISPCSPVCYRLEGWLNSLLEVSEVAATPVKYARIDPDREATDEL